MLVIISYKYRSGETPFEYELRMPIVANGVDINFGCESHNCQSAENRRRWRTCFVCVRVHVSLSCCRTHVTCRKPEEKKSAAYTKWYEQRCGEYIYLFSILQSILDISCQLWQLIMLDCASTVIDNFAFKINMLSYRISVICHKD